MVVGFTEIDRQHGSWVKTALKIKMNRVLSLFGEVQAGARRGRPCSDSVGRGYLCVSLTADGELSRAVLKWNPNLYVRHQN